MELFYLLFFIIFIGCSNPSGSDGSDSQTEESSDSNEDSSNSDEDSSNSDDITDIAANENNGFSQAIAVGDVGLITINSESISMVYVNSDSSLIFPVGYDNTGTQSIGREFFAGETEVTNAQMAEVLQWAYDNNFFSEEPFVSNQISSDTVKFGGVELINLYSSECKINYNSGSFSVISGYEDYPVVELTWYGAILFCNWLTQMRDGNTDNLVYSGIPDSGFWDHEDTSRDLTKDGYRLPESYEWEFVARYLGTSVPSDGDLSTTSISAGVNDGSLSLTSGYYWTSGDYVSGQASEDTIDNNYSKLKAVYDYTGSNYTAAQEVKSLSSNYLGLYDVSGNVWEWTFTLPDNHDSRTNRGGCFTSNSGYCSVGSVGGTSQLPHIEDEETGFRVYRTKVDE